MLYFLRSQARVPAEMQDSGTQHGGVGHEGSVVAHASECPLLILGCERLPVAMRTPGGRWMVCLPCPFFSPLTREGSAKATVSHVLDVGGRPWLASLGGSLGRLLRGGLGGLG